MELIKNIQKSIFVMISLNRFLKNTIFVIMSCLAAMIFVVLAAAVQGIENAVRRLIRSAHPGQEVSA